MADLGFLQTFFSSSVVFVENFTWPGPTRVGRSQISYKRSVKLSPGAGGGGWGLETMNGTQKTHLMKEKVVIQ